MDTQELLKKVRKVEIKTRGISNHIFAGEYHSVFKGRGMSFAEVREYSYGDDVRNIDWNVTARFNHPYVKVFEEERELTVMLIVDISRSDFFGTREKTKRELMTEIAAVLSFSAINNNDKVGMIFFTDRIEKFIPPKKGRGHILRIIRELIDFEPTGKKTDIASALEYFSSVMKKKTIAFLLSDFLDMGYYKPLSIASRKHDLVGIHISDPGEHRLPDIGMIKAEDPETGNRMLVDTSSKKTRHAYNAWFDERRNYARKNFRRTGADLIEAKTNLPYINILLGFFRKREKKI